MTEPTTGTPVPSPRRPWWRRRWVWAVVAVAVVFFLIGILTHGTPPPANSAATLTTSNPAPATTGTTATWRTVTSARPPTSANVHPTTIPARPPATTPAAPADTLTGYGATISAWNAHHTADTDYDPGSAYDPDPSLPRANGHTGARYVAVMPISGRVTDYTVNMNATTVTNAESTVIHEFPPDTRVLWTNPIAGCTQVEYVSPTLHTVLNAGTPDTGDALVEYSNANGSASPVTEAQVSDMAGTHPDPSATC